MTDLTDRTTGRIEMSNLIDRLRNIAHGQIAVSTALTQAADRIEKLEVTLREAVAIIASLDPGNFKTEAEFQRAMAFHIIQTTIAEEESHD